MFENGTKFERRRIETYHVVDSIMGSGKTTAVFDYIREHDDIRFIYVVPLLSEVQRALDELEGFKTPARYGNKLTGLKYLLSKNKNIITTHALFAHVDDECRAWIRSGKYVLVMDECYDPFAERSNDIDDDVKLALDSGAAHIGEDGYICWDWKEYGGEGLRKVREDCDSKRLIYWKGACITISSPETFTAFEEGFVLTYMFKGQALKYYFDVNGIEFDYRYVTPDRKLTCEPVEVPHQKYSELIHILNEDKLNEVGDSITSLSKTHFQKFGKGLTDKLRNNMYTYTRRRIHATSKDIMWTCYKSWEKDLALDGCRKGFVPCNTKATNEFAGKRVLLYILNRYMNVGVKNYLIGNGATIDEDEFALSEMLQWIFRSAVRNGEEIWIYIPSRRMRGLLLSWIKEVDGSATV